jgi:hypothetical protein
MNMCDVVLQMKELFVYSLPDAENIGRNSVQTKVTQVKVSDADTRTPEVDEGRHHLSLVRWRIRHDC